MAMAKEQLALASSEAANSSQSPGSDQSCSGQAEQDDGQRGIQLGALLDHCVCISSIIASAFTTREIDQDAQQVGGKRSLTGQIDPTAHCRQRHKRLSASSDSTSSSTAASDKSVPELVLSRGSTPAFSVAGEITLDDGMLPSTIMSPDKQISKVASDDPNDHFWQLLPEWTTVTWNKFETTYLAPQTRMGMVCTFARYLERCISTLLLNPPPSPTLDCGGGG